MWSASGRGPSLTCTARGTGAAPAAGGRRTKAKSRMMPSSSAGSGDAPGGGPMRVGVAVADLFTGMYAANAILAALLRREASGEGAVIDLALLNIYIY